MTAYRDALRSVEFRALLGSWLVSILGNVCAYVAISVLVYDRTRSPLLAALTMAVAFAPYLLGGTLLSGLVDRLAPKRVLVGFDLLSACLVGVMLTPGLPVAAFFALLFAIGTLAPIRSGVQQAVLVDVLAGDAYVAGRSAMRVCSMCAQVVGYAAGGGLVAALGPRGTLAADVGSFVVSAGLCAAFVRRRPARGVAAGQPLLADSVRGIRAVWADRAVRRVLLLGWLLPTVAVAPEALAAPAVAQTGHGSGFVGLWLALVPLGMGVGDVLVVLAFSAATRERLVAPLAVVSVLVLAAFTVRPPLTAAFVLLVASGLTSAYVPGLDQQLRDRTPDHLRGRTFTVNQAGTMVVQGLGFALAGALAELVPAATAVGLCGALGVVGLVALAITRPRRAAGAAPVEGAAPAEELVPVAR